MPGSVVDQCDLFLAGAADIVGRGTRRRRYCRARDPAPPILSGAGPGAVVKMTAFRDDVELSAAERPPDATGATFRRWKATGGSLAARPTPAGAPRSTEFAATVGAAGTRAGGRVLGDARMVGGHPAHN